MDSIYEIFEEDCFNMVVKLVEKVDRKLVKRYEDVLRSLPNKILKALAVGDDFEMFSSEYDADLLRMSGSGKDSIFFTFKNYKKDLKIELNILPYTEDDISAEEEYKPVFIFSLSLTMKDNKGMDWEVYIQPHEDRFQLISIKNMNGEMVGQQVIQDIPYSELLEHANYEEYDESDEEDDEEIEFDGVAEYDKDGNLVTKLFKPEDLKDVKIDEESGKPEVEVELHVELPDDEEDPFDDKTDYYTP